MAVVGLVVLCEQEKVEAVAQQLAGYPCVDDVMLADESFKLAAVLETDSDKVESALKELLLWDGVLTVDVAFVSYEDELSAGKNIKCPPHEPRKHG